MRHLMSPLDFSVEELDTLLDLAQDIEKNPKKYAHACDGKKLATLFYEPSTRTRLSHEAAMLNLGGNIMGFSSANSSSAAKGESVSDTIRTISCYADICAMRHPKEGAPMVACQHSTIPVINAGDGGHEHPTQTLTDLLTIRNVKGRLDNMTIGLCGDLKFGRTVHSLIHALVRYPGIKFVLISPEELRLPDYVRHDVLDKMNIPYKEVVRLEDGLPELDILYMTRVQKERFFNEEDYVRMKDFYILDKKKMENPAAIIDANHSNSNKKFKEQIRITSEVLHSRSYNPELKKLIKGVMIESYLEEGNQKICPDMIYGKSITDPCLGWEDTERLIYEIAEKC
jgi:aspartate carbamoyltransferase catalytic subunit